MNEYRIVIFTMVVKITRHYQKKSTHSWVKVSSSARHLIIIYCIGIANIITDLLYVYKTISYVCSKLQENTIILSFLLIK